MPPTSRSLHHDATAVTTATGPILAINLGKYKAWPAFTARPKATRSTRSTHSWPKAGVVVKLVDQSGSPRG
jgi:hypothetical protein